MKVATMKGKTIYGFGDSLVEGHCLKVGMLDALAEKNGMKLVKYARNGATVIPDSSNADERGLVPDVAEQIVRASEEVPDYVCFDGLTNDACRPEPAKWLGKMETGYQGPYDTATFYGAFERVCRLLRTKYQESRVIYICVHKMPTRDFAAQDILQKAAREVCAKWSIPCVDIYRSGLINTCLDGMRKAYSYNTAEFPQDGNGTHLNAAGYEKWYLPMIEQALIYGI